MWPGPFEVLYTEMKDHMESLHCVYVRDGCVWQHCDILFLCVSVYRVAMTVLVEVPGSIETPLHLWNRLRGISQLREETRKQTKIIQFKK